jgi:hypothetical protein
MKFRRVDPRERFDGLHFNPLEQCQGAINFGNYTCPHCKQITRFRETDFEKGQKNSPFTQDEQKRVDRRSVKTKRGEITLDFHCPGCGNPVRILYVMDTMVAHGTFSYEIVGAVEVEKE